MNKAVATIIVLAVLIVIIIMVAGRDEVPGTDMATTTDTSANIFLDDNNDIATSTNNTGATGTATSTF